MAEAIEAYNNRQFTSLKAVAEHFEVSRSILTHWVSGHHSRVQARQNQQLLSAVEESTLVKWICQFPSIGRPIRHQLIKELAEEIRI